MAGTRCFRFTSPRSSIWSRCETSAALAEILDITRRTDAFEAASAADPKLSRYYPTPPFVYYPVTGDTAAYLAFLKESLGSYDDL